MCSAHSTLNETDPCIHFDVSDFLQTKDAAM